MTTPGLHPVPGQGVLSRHGGLILLCSADDRSAPVVEAVLAAHEEVAHAGGDGTALADRLSALLAGTGETSVVAFGPAGGSVIVAVFGHAWADVTTEHGEQRLALRQSRDGVRSVLPGTLLSIRAGLGDVDVELAPDRWGNLEHGTVHAAGMLYVAAAGAVSAAPATGAAEANRAEPATAELPIASVADLAPPPPATPMPASAPSPRPSPGPPPGSPMPPRAAEPPPPTPLAPTPTSSEPPVTPPDMPAVEQSAPSVDRSQPFSSVVLVHAAGAAPQAQEREPLPIAAPPPEPVAPEVAPAAHPVDDESVEVLGVYCKNGHFDDPAARYCAICGISMAQLTLVPRPGPRPPLGVLVLDDGSIFSIDTDYVIGRDPSRDQRVTGGAARPMRVDDPQGLISRAHAQIRLDGWQVQVVDLGSANGTGIWGPSDSAWRPIPRLTPVTIRPGTQVGFGQRQLRYESHRNT